MTNQKHVERQQLWATMLARHQNLCRSGAPAETCIADDEILTQYGRGGKFWPSPREEELDVSLLIGTYTPQEAHDLVVGKRKRRVFPGAPQARHTTAGRLRSEGFTVVHTPNVGKLQHGSAIICLPGELATPTHDWPPGVLSRFETCFTGGGDMNVEIEE